MIPIERLRKIEPAFEDLTDEQIVKIRELLNKFAILALEVYIEKKSGSKNPVRSFEMPDIEM